MSVLTRLPRLCNVAPARQGLRSLHTALHNITPRTIAKILNEHVIGQERAKKILSVAVYNHYARLQSNLERAAQQQSKHDAPIGEPASLDSSAPSPSSLQYNDQPLLERTPLATGKIENGMPEQELISAEAGTQSREPIWLNQYPHHEHTQAGSIATDATRNPSSEPSSEDGELLLDKSNVLLVGPTGSGKTLLAKTLADILQVPFSISDATPLTQAGYVGEDVELVIQRLLQSCDYDVAKAETGIVFIDEIDKISRRSEALSTSKDVGGEGVQQSLLRMLEGTVVTVTDKGMPTTSSANTRKPIQPPMAAITSGTLMGSSINPSDFNANPPLSSTLKGGPLGGSGGGDTFAVDTTNILFILSGAFIGLEKVVMDRLARGSMGFDATLKAAESGAGQASSPRTEGQEQVTAETALDYLEPHDMIKYGLIPEFVGRLPILANLNQLTESDLVRVLTEPKNSLVRQYECLFALSQVKLKFTGKALRAIARQAVEKKSGARGLRRIMENLLLDPMYDAPASSIRHVVVTEDVVNQKYKPLYYARDQLALAEKTMRKEDAPETDHNTISTAAVQKGGSSNSASSSAPTKNATPLVQPCATVASVRAAVDSYYATDDISS